MIRVVDATNAAEHRFALDQLRAMLLRAEAEGDSAAALKRRALPDFTVQRSAYVLDQSFDGNVVFGVSLSPAAAAHSIHTFFADLGELPPPRHLLLECIFLRADHVHDAVVSEERLDAFWQAVLKTAARLGATDIAGFDFHSSGQGGEGDRAAADVNDFDCSLFEISCVEFHTDIPAMLPLAKSRYGGQGARW